MLGIITIGCGDRSNNEIIKSLESPDGSHVAYIFIRNMGATTEESYQLSILKKDEKLKNKAGNVFIKNGEFDIKWESEKELVIKDESSGEVFKDLKEYDGIKITHYSGKPK